MLILTRKPGGGDESSITLPDLGVVFRVLEVRSFNQVRIGIEAPGIRIVRTELLERPQIELGAPPAIKPEHLADIREVLDDDCDAEPLPRFMTPMQKVDYYTRGIDSKPAPRSVRAGDEAND